MAAPVLATKLFIPPLRANAVVRTPLIAQLNEGLYHKQGFGRKLTLISAPAGFGKTTLVSEWLASGEKPEVRPAWLSLDQEDSDITRFLTYLIAAFRTLVPQIGEGLLRALQSPQPPPAESILTSLLNEIAAVPGHFLLILDDYHVIDARPVDQALAFLLEYLPPHMHLVICTREDPPLPLARLRARGQFKELRAADLRFTLFEAAEFLNQAMGLKLSAEDIAALETRTEGWIAGLQLAALALQGSFSVQAASTPSPKDISHFIQSFTGSHQYVIDYLVEEVLRQQSESIQAFLLHTAILDRLCGPLCDAVLKETSGQETLEALERANLFIVPLDNERRWYRYHHLFADLLRQRLQQQAQKITGSSTAAESYLNELHTRASQWYEDNGLPLEAFHHAAAGQDIDRANHLTEEKGIPLHFGGPVSAILHWLDSLPKSALDARPTLWWRYASLLLIAGRTDGVEEKLQAAEAALAAQTTSDYLGDRMAEEEARNLVGQIAAARATLALTRYDVETMLTQSRRALASLHPTSLFTRATAYWTQGYACLLLGERAAARQSLVEAIALSKSSGAVFTLILATIGLGNVQEADNQLHQAADTYAQVIQWAGDQPQQIIHEAHLGMARILYEWNNLDAAEQHGLQSIHLARQYDVKIIDRFILCEVFLTRLKLAQGDIAAADVVLSQTEQSAHQPAFRHRIPEVAFERVRLLLRQGNLAAAARLAQTHPHPFSQARVSLAQRNPSAALAVLAPYRQQVETRGWQDDRLKVMVLQAVALQALGETNKAIPLLDDALALAEPGGFIRIFVDEGLPMAQLLAEAVARGRMTGYIRKLLAAFDAEAKKLMPADQPQIEPLSQRELEVLHLIAQGLSNQAISERLFLALDTVKGHNRKIFEKLQVQRRTEAVARARELGLL